MTTSTRAHDLPRHQLMKAEARDAMRRLGAIAPPPGTALRCQDCLLVGIWRRLGERKLDISEFAWSKYEEAIAAGHRPSALRPGEPATLLVGDPNELYAQLLFVRVAIGTDEIDCHTPEIHEEQLLVIDGLIGALFA